MVIVLVASIGEGSVPGVHVKGENGQVENGPGEVIVIVADGRKDRGIVVRIAKGVAVVRNGVKVDGVKGRGPKDRGAKRDVAARKKEQNVRNVLPVRRVAGDGPREIGTRVGRLNGTSDQPARKRRR